MKKNQRYGVIPRMYDVPMSAIYKNKLEQNTVFKRGNVFNFLGSSNEIELPSSYILIGQDTNKDGIIDDNDIKVDSYGQLNIRVEDQGEYNLCWGFASIKSLETNLALNGYGEYDFSELHLDYLQSNLFGNELRMLHDGGNFMWLEDYIKLEQGPVLESEVPYYAEYSSISDYEYLQSLFKRVNVNDEDFINMPTIDKINRNYVDNELMYFRKVVKEHIMKNGSLEASICSTNIVSSIDNRNMVLNYQGDLIADHSISIIGWDDNFSKENFPKNCRPNSDGAYIALNSWGKSWGNYGIFYISYEDILVEESMNGVSNAYPLDVLDIYVDTKPYKNSYIAGEEFDRDGMVIKAKYSDEQEVEITNYTVYPEIIDENTEYVTISYTEGNSTKTINYKIDVYDSKESIDDEINLYYDSTNKVLRVTGNGNLKSNLDNYDIEKLIIEDGIKEISSNCINNLSNLNRIYILDKDCKITNNFNINDNIIIYCYKNSSIKEQCEENNINYFEYDNYYKCGKQAYAFLNKEDNKLIISGKGRIYEYLLKEIPWKEENSYIKNIEIDDGILNISNKLFAENTYIETVKLGNDVIEIGDRSFYDCISLRQIELNDKLKSIGNSAFYNCKELKEIFIYDNVEEIGEYCFYNCENLIEVKLPSKISVIASYMFYNCKSLKEIEIPDNIYYFQNRSFMNCMSLEKIKMPKELTILGTWAFVDCTNLKEIDFSKCNPAQIADTTFYGCSSLEELIMPDSIESIGQGVFGQCSSLKRLEFSHGLTRLYSGTAQYCSSLEEISIPYGIKKMGNWNFSGGSNLKKVILPCSLESIEEKNFTDCNNLQYLIIPDSLNINNEIDLIGDSEANPIIYCKSDSSIKEYAVNKGINYITDDIEPNLNVNLDKEFKRITIIASDDNEIVGLSDYPYSFDGGETWQNESYMDVYESGTITVCVRDAVGNIARQEIEVKNDIVGMKLTKPNKLIYVKGEELDLTGGKLEVVYKDGSKEEVEITPEMITGYDTTIVGIGTYTITVTYEGYTTTFEIEVTNDIVGIVVKQTPDKIKYIKGEQLDLTGSILEIEYEDGSKEEMEIPNLMIVGYDSTLVGVQNVKVVYKNLSTSFEIEVTNNIRLMQIESKPKKLIYIKGEELDLTGGILELTYQDGSKTEVEMTNEEVKVTGYDSTLVGLQKVILEYKGFKEAFSVRVTNNVVGIELIKQPDKLKYIKGEGLDLTGGILELTHQDGSKEEVEITREMVTRYDSTLVGVQKIILEYKDFTASFEIEVTNDIVGIKLIKPNKLKYVKGEELDLTGGILKVTYEDGSKEDIELTEEIISGYDKNAVRIQKITVAYKNVVTFFEIEVTNEVIGIEIKSNPNKVKYIKGEELDLTGGILEIKYEDGTKEEIEMTSVDVKATGYDKDTVGIHTITVTYKGFTAIFEVEVTNEVTGIEIKTNPNKVKYIKGEELDLTGGILEVTYEDGTKEEIEMTTEMVTGYDKNLVGLQSIKVGYKNFATSFSVEVTNNIVEIVVKQNPNKVKYIKGEGLDLTGAVLEEIYEDGSKKEVEMTLEMVTGYDKTKLGEQEITVTYGEFRTTFKVEVTNEVTEIVIKTNPNKVKYIKGEELDLTGGILELTYEDGTKEEIEMTSVDVKTTGYEKDVLGKQIITVTYKGFTAIFEVEVTNEVTEIVIKTNPNKVKYIKGEELDLTGGILELTYQDGSKEEKEITAEMVTGYDKTKLGEQEVTVEYEGFKTTFKVTVMSEEIKFNNYIPYMTGEENYIEEIYENETVKDLKEDVITDGIIKIYNKENEEILEDNVKLATGMKLEIIINDKVVKYSIVVTGDINGDGKVDIIDQSILAGYMVQNEKTKEIMVGAHLRASNIVKDDKFGNILDIAKLARVLVGLEDIKSK